MAVDASQILLNREMGNFVEANYGNIYNTSSTPMGYGLMQGPLSGTTTATDGLIPMYDAMVADSVMAKTLIKSESGLSYAVPISRKRPRGGEAVVVNNNHHHHQFVTFPPNFQIHQNNNYRSTAAMPFTFLGEDLSGHFQHEQSEIDRFIAQHAQKVRMEIEEKRKSYSRRIIAEVEDVIVKKLRSKEEEIEKIGKVNLALEERVKSLCVENQIWRELAQTNEATANALRSNLEQILVQLQEDQQQRHHLLLRQNAGAELADDAQSCCGSNCAEEGGGDAAAVNSRAGGTTTSHGGGGGGGEDGRINNSRMCRNCWKEEANVLIMPCRHLCLCHACGPLLHNCPICNSVQNLMVPVNLIPS